MKIKLDSIQASDVLEGGKKHKAELYVRLSLADAEMLTEHVKIKPDEANVFPDVFEFDIDAEKYIAGVLEVIHSSHQDDPNLL